MKSLHRISDAAAGDARAGLTIQAPAEHSSGRVPGAGLCCPVVIAYSIGAAAGRLRSRGHIAGLRPEPRRFSWPPSEAPRGTMAARELRAPPTRSHHQAGLGTRSWRQHQRSSAGWGLIAAYTQVPTMPEPSSLGTSPDAPGQGPHVGSEVAALPRRLPAGTLEPVR